MIYALSNRRFHNSETAIEEFELLNKRQLFNVAKESIASYGSNLDVAENMIKTKLAQSQRTDAQLERARRRHVDLLFPEVD